MLSLKLLEAEKLIDAAQVVIDARLDALTIKAVTDQDSLAVIRADYRAVIADAMTEYLASDRPVTGPRKLFRKAATEHLQPAFWRGYGEAAGEIDYQDADARDWINSRVLEEIGYISTLFVSLRQLRDEFIHGEADSSVLRDEVDNRTNGYADTLEACYIAGKMFGKKNVMLEWVYGDTEHCNTCAALNGQRHRAKWYIARDYIPRKPGAAMACGGYRCQCTLLDPDGKDYTL
jgi:hypothetical protein